MKILLNILILFVASLAHSQLVTNVGQSPASLVQNVLLGGGVTVSNVAYYGSPTAIGSFTTGSSNLGLSSGIVMSTGTVLNNGQGPHGPNNVPNAGVDNGYPGSPLLTAQIGAPTFNSATLEFDFIPYSDSVRFRYVFGSEEYPEFVGTKFNDLFGFFISGPGIPTPTNIALLPNSSRVEINKVNAGMNSQFFVNNAGGSSIQYDGFTTVLTATSKVQCGKTYHLKIAIADVTDGIYDSGVFLEANSLVSKKTVEISGTVSYKAYPNDPLKMAEGCVKGTVTLKRTTELQKTLVVPISVSGSATSGVDYSPAIPSTVTFNPGDVTKSFSFDAIADALTEGVENILMTFDLKDPCGNPAPENFEMRIADIEDVDVTLPDTLTFCPGDEALLIPIPTGGVGPYSYLWGDGSTASTLLVNPTVTTSYNVTVKDNCLLESATTSGTVTVPVYQPVQVFDDGDETVLCPYIPDTISAFATGGTGVYQYTWYDGATKIGNKDSIVVIPPFTKTYMVVAADQCGLLDTNYLIYTILSPPLLLKTAGSTEICPGDPAEISVAGSGGFGNYYYYWPSSGETTPSIVVNPYFSDYFVVEVRDDCQTFTVYDSVYIKVIKPLADFEISSKTIYEGLPITFKNTTKNGQFYSWNFGDGNTSNLIHPNNTFSSDGFYTITLIAEDHKGCLDTNLKTIEILKENYLYVPNSFTPDGDRFNNAFRVSALGITEFNIRIFDRWGKIIFESNDASFEWDGAGRKDNKDFKQDVYNYIITYSTPYEIDNIKQGHVVLIK